MGDGANAPVMSTRLRAYLALVACAGTAVLALSIADVVRTPAPLGLLALAAATILAGCFRLRFASVKANIAIDDTFFITAALLFGPGAAALVTAIAAGLFSVQRRQPARRVLFNATSHAVSMGVAAHAFFVMAGVAPLTGSGAPIAQFVGPLIVLTIVYFTLNSWLTALAAGLETRQSAIDVWTKNFRWLWIGYLGSASIAFCLVLLLQQRSVTATAMVLPLFAVFYLTLRSTFGRLDDARRHLADMDRLYLSTVETLAMAIDAKDDVTHSHVRRVQAYAVGLARALAVNDEATLKAIEAAALLHDTGKLAVPEHILNKPGKLTVAEFERMKQHVDVGADILTLVEFPYPVVPIVRAHHENWDGTGYPRGMRGDQIPIGARILSVVDCFDALTSDRPYRRRMTDAAAIDILLERRGRMYDPAVVDMFVRVYRTIDVGDADATEHREVLQRITQSRADAAGAERVAAPAADPTAAPNSLLAFVSLSRVASGEATVADVAAIGSRLMGDIAPGISGAWFVPTAERDRMIAVDAFGPSAAALRGMSIGVGERRTGWVAANRQPIVNSPADLDLGGRVDGVDPPLRTCTSVPLMAGETLAAVLSIYSPERDAATEDLGRLAEMLAPHLARAIDATASGPLSIDVRSPEKPSASSLRLVSTR